jgi:hypothetical protein
MSGQLHAGVEIRRAGDIPAVRPEEAGALEAVELGRFQTLIERLPADAWREPVPGAPKNWDVRAVVAQVTGEYAAQASFAQFRRQANPFTLRFYHNSGRGLLETVRRAQVGERMYRKPDELMEELRIAGPKALRHREIAFRPLAYFSRPGDRTLALPSVPLGPFASVASLWFHRLTIADISGVATALDVEHDGRIIASLLRPAAGAALRDLPDVAVELAVAEMPETRIGFGGGDAIVATVVIESTPFVQLSGRRRTAAWAREHSTIDGEVRSAMKTLTAISVVSERRPY